MDRSWEIVGTVAVGVALAAFLAYHKGKGTPDISMTSQRQPLPPPQQPPTLGDIIDGANRYNSGDDFGGNTYTLDLTAPVYNIVQKVDNTTFNFPNLPLIPLNVENITNIIQTTQLGDVITRPVYNVSSGTPQCGQCTTPDVTDLNAMLAAEHDKFNQILALLAAIHPTEPATNVYVTLKQAAGAQPTPPFFSANPQGKYTTTDASGNQTTHYTGEY